MRVYGHADKPHRSSPDHQRPRMQPSDAKIRRQSIDPDDLIDAHAHPSVATA